MKEIHQRIAMIGLREAEEYGFVLAGGYAISANGMGDRPSMDVDLFTNRLEPDRFAEAVERVRSAFAEAGFDVEEVTMGPTFADMHVVDRTTGEFSDIQFGVNYREFPPVRIAIGPVLDVRDAVAGKMSALWSRGEVRDFIDIDTVVTSGRFTREDVLAIGDRQEATPMDRAMLAQRFAMLSDPRQADKYDPVEFAKYGVEAELRTAIVDRFAQWSADVDPARVGAPATLDLYHRTSVEAAAQIAAEGRFLTRENTPEAYVSTRAEGHITGYGPAVVHVRVAANDAQLDDEFPDGEEHYRIPLDRAEVVDAFTMNERGERVPLGRDGTATDLKDLTAVRAAFPRGACDAVRAPRTPQVGNQQACRPRGYERGQGTER